MTNNHNGNSNLAERIVFNGINVDKMFVGENVSLPELGVGEILVKVIEDLFIYFD